MTEKPDEAQEPDHTDTPAQPALPSPKSLPATSKDRVSPTEKKNTGKGDQDNASSVARELHWLEKLNIAGQMGLVLVGIIAASIYGCQLHVMQGQLDQMSKQFPEIQKSASAAESAARTTHDALVINERSRVGFPLFNIGPPRVVIGPNVELRGNLELENFGKTPASIDFVGVKLEVRDTPVPDGFKYAPPLISSKFDLLPGQKGYHSADSKYTISGSDYQAVMLRKKRLVLHGRVRYHDAFGAYASDVCWNWELDDTLFSPCSEHNCMDEECKADK